MRTEKEGVGVKGADTVEANRLLCRRESPLQECPVSSPLCVKVPLVMFPSSWTPVHLSSCNLPPHPRVPGPAWGSSPQQCLPPRPHSRLPLPLFRRLTGVLWTIDSNKAESTSGVFTEIIALTCCPLDDSFFLSLFLSFFLHFLLSVFLLYVRSLPLFHIVCSFPSFSSSPTVYNLKLPFLPVPLLTPEEEQVSVFLSTLLSFSLLHHRYYIYRIRHVFS